VAGGRRLGLAILKGDLAGGAGAFRLIGPVTTHQPDVAHAAVAAKVPGYGEVVHSTNGYVIHRFGLQLLSCKVVLLYFLRVLTRRSLAAIKHIEFSRSINLLTLLSGARGKKFRASVRARRK
jgi:hypothetical protein